MKNWNFRSFDGTGLAIHETGEGRPLVLLHGLFSSAEMNWNKFGHAALLANAGFRVIMPDLRAHGHSEAPHDPAAYPRDVLVRDALALIDHLQLDDFDLGGFSLGARTTAKLLTGWLEPGKAILAGMGLEGLGGWDQRRLHFRNVIAVRDTVKRGDPEYMAVQFMKTMKIDPVAAGHLLESFGDVDVDALSSLNMPVQILCGEDDCDNGSPDALAEILPFGTLSLVPGTHMSSVTHKALGEAMVSFLTA
ncbi:MAG: alpha/beta hydrolase [Blastomonas sp.]